MAHIADREAIWLPVAGPVDVARLRGLLVEALSIPLEGPTATRVERILAAHGPMLVVLDGLGEPDEAVDGELRRWLAANPELGVLVTCRHGPSPDRRDGPISVALGPLSVRADEGLSDAARLVMQRARHMHPGCAPPSPEQAEALARLLDGLPEAIVLSVSRLGIFSPGQLLAQIDALGRADSIGPALSALVDDLLGELSPADRALVAALTVFDRGFEAPDAVAVLGPVLGGAGAVLDGLSRLTQRFIVNRMTAHARSSSRRLIVMGCVAERASQTADPDLGPARAAHARFFAQRASERHVALRTEAGPAARGWFAAEKGNIQRAWATCCAHGQREALAMSGWRLAMTCSAPSAGWADRPIPLAQADRLRPTVEAVAGWLSLAYMAARHGDLDAASTMCDRAADLADDPASAGRVEGVRATVLTRRGRVAEALEAHARAIVGLADGSDHALGWARANQGQTLMHAGRADEAIATMRAATSHFEACGDRYGMAVTQGNLAIVYGGQGELSTALELVSRAVEHGDAIDAPRARVNHRTVLAWLKSETGDLDGALTTLDQALPELERMGEPRILCSAYIEQAVALHRRGALASARSAYRRAVEQAHRTQGLFYRAQLEGYRAALEAMAGCPAEARAHIERAAGFAEQAPETRLMTVVELLGHQVELAERPTLVADGRLDEAHRRVREARSAVSAARRMGPSPPPYATYWRRVVQLLDAAVDAAAEALDTPLPAPEGDGRWAVEPGAVGLWTPEGAHIDLRRSRVLRRLLGALVRAHAEAPGSTLDADAMWKAGWGDEQVREASRRNRLHVSIAKLRAAGLRPLLQRIDSGYRLDPEAPIATIGG